MANNPLPLLQVHDYWTYPDRYSVVDAMWTGHREKDGKFPEKVTRSQAQSAFEMVLPGDGAAIGDAVGASGSGLLSLTPLPSLTT